jgi:hypothetical protein
MYGGTRNTPAPQHIYYVPYRYAPEQKIAAVHLFSENLSSNFSLSKCGLKIKSSEHLGRQLGTQHVSDVSHFMERDEIGNFYGYLTHFLQCGSSFCSG